jgi:tetratricopeptide (TPR) repeat protein
VKLRYTLFTLLFSAVLLCLNSNAQTSTDSLRQVLTHNISDSARVTTLLALAKAYRNQVPDSAIAIGRRAVKIAESTKNLTLLASAERTVGAGYYFKGDYKGAAEQEQKALKIFRQLNDTLQVAMSENNIGSNFLSLGSYDSALLHLARSRRQFRILQDTAKELFVANNIGIILIRQANYPEAMRTYLEALETAELYNDEDTRLKILNNIGVIYEKQGNWDEALAIGLDLLEAYRKQNNRVQEALTLNNIGTLYDNLGEPEKARDYLTNSIKLYSSLDNQDGVAIAKSNLGSQLVAQGNVKQALPILLEANNYYKQVDNKSGETRTAVSLALAYVALEQLDLAEQFGQRALTLYKVTGENKVGPEVYQALHEVYAAKGNYKLAYSYHKRYKSLADSIFNIDKESEINRLAYLSQLKENEGLKRADSLQSEKLRIQQQYAERNQLLLAWITLAALLLAGIVLVYVLKDKKIRQAYRQLRDQNLEIVKNREDISQQAQQLKEANEEIQRINENLEAIVRARTEELESKNRQLEEYAFLNAHKLRAPVARLLGLIHVAKLTQNSEELRELFMLSQHEAGEVDRIVKKIGQAIQNGVPLDRWGIDE